MTDALLVYCTFPNHENAASVAQILVSEGLAACVNLFAPILSIYRWEGKLVEESEVQATIKTEGARFRDLEKRILELHSYSCPEIIAIPIAAGHQGYLDWIREQVQPPSAP